MCYLLSIQINECILLHHVLIYCDSRQSICHVGTKWLESCHVSLNTTGETSFSSNSNCLQLPQAKCVQQSKQGQAATCYLRQKMPIMGHSHILIGGFNGDPSHSLWKGWCCALLKNHHLSCLNFPKIWKQLVRTPKVTASIPRLLGVNVSVTILWPNYIFCNRMTHIS